MNENIEINSTPTIQPEPKKNKTPMIILVVVIILVIIGGVAFVGFKYMKKDSKTTETEKKESSGIKIVNKDDPVEMKAGEADPVEVNKELSKFNVLLHFTFDYERDNKLVETNWYKKDKIVYGRELLRTESQKNDFIFGAIYLYNLETEPIIDKTYDGIEATGGYAVRKSLFAETYNSVLGLPLPEQEKYSSNEYEFLVVKDDYVYGAFWTGYPEFGTVLKYDGMIEDSAGNYTVFIAVLEGDETELKQYEDPSVTSGYEDKIAYSLILTVNKTDSGVYRIKSLQPFKLEK